MPSNTRITKLTDYTSVLPYASEMFGVYQPMIGWKSKKQQDRHEQSKFEMKTALLQAYAKKYKPVADISFNQVTGTAQINQLQPGKEGGISVSFGSKSQLLNSIASDLPIDRIPHEQEWQEYINEQALTKNLHEKVFPFYNAQYKTSLAAINSRIEAVQGEQPGEDPHDAEERRAATIRAEELQKPLTESNIKTMINQESAVAGTLLGLFDNKLYDQLEKIFYEKAPPQEAIEKAGLDEMLKQDDPFLTFDPKKDIKDVSISPLGIVHLFRQYFFELDTFLGTPTGHVWLSPGSSVELIEVSTRKTVTEKTVEAAFESAVKNESSSTTQDEIAKAVKDDNRSDSKAGFSGTLNQSWVGGSASATASLNLENTQQTARETTHKKMRQQSAKLSTEIKQNYKSTFKTITEVSDVSSKRYLLNNSTANLVNYELRRKMRQVGVQVQDIGTYLCWETFVDEPGKQLGLANLVHIAKPAELYPMPDQTLLPDPPPDLYRTFELRLVWGFTDQSGPAKGHIFADKDNLIILKTEPLVVEIPSGYRIAWDPDGGANKNVKILFQKDCTNPQLRWAWGARLTGNGNIIDAGVYCPPDNWQFVANRDRETFSVTGSVRLVPTPEKLKEVADANSKIIKDGKSTTLANSRKENEAYLEKAKERIKLSHQVDIRKFEDLREEERVIVYRNLIKALLSDTLYNLPDTTENLQSRHTLSELLNAIFDIDKMLYFVAPEWWKPRTHQHQYIGEFDLHSNTIKKPAANAAGIANSMMVLPFNNSNKAQVKPIVNSYGGLKDSVVNWADQDFRPDNYYITEDSKTARLGSSLGWLMQLDGDDLRNAFLNAPWVRAVIPVRPGKEQEAINWLQQMNVEGTDGLNDNYVAPVAELRKINPGYPDTPVLIKDAINYLCKKVAEKHAESMVTDKYPKEEINDANRVSATPVDKVYEHGFYPLEGGFRAVTTGNFEVFDQWIEVLPTDQVVPVEVEYDPVSGRQKKRDIQ